MKWMRMVAGVALVAGLAACNADRSGSAPSNASEFAPDTVDVGGDEYGMASYVMAFLHAGPNRSQDSLEAAELQSAHLANIARMAEEGSLLIAGPFLDAGAVRGIYIFDVPDTVEARRLTETDPAIQAGRLRMELRPWYGPAVLRRIPALHEANTHD